MKKLILLLIPILLLLSGCNHNGPDAGKLTTKGKYYSVEGTVDGIKIKIKDGLKIRDNAGSTFRVFDSSGKELPLYITIENEERNTRKEYIYRFVEANKEYVIEWFCIFVDDKGKETDTVWDKTKCTPKGGLDLSDYLNVSTVENAKMSLNYDKASASFTIKLPTSAQTLSDFAKDDSIFSEINFKFRTLLGELYWAHTEYVDDQWLHLKGPFANADPTSDISKAKVDGFHVYKNFPEYQKREFENKYCGHLLKQFVYDEGSYRKTIYENTTWTDQMKFN
jgi:hypothetical protein